MSHWAAAMGKLRGPATCVPRKDGDFLNVLSKYTRELAAFSSHYLFHAERQTRKLSISYVMVFLLEFVKGIEPMFTDRGTNAKTTTPRRQSCWLLKQSMLLCGDIAKPNNYISDFINNLDVFSFK